MAHVVNLNAYAPPSHRPGVFARVRDAITIRAEFARVRDELDAFSDRDLADIGLSRHTIADVARAAAHGR